MFEQLVGLAREHLRKAIVARERIYQGQRDARQQFKKAWAATGYANGALSEADAEYRWMESVKCKSIIADQNWQMRQADAHSNLATATGIEQLLVEQRRTNYLLEELLKVNTNMDKEANGG